MDEETKFEEKQKLEDIGRRVFRHPNAESFEMKRVPKDTIEIFKKLANEEFVGDYGFCFKAVLEGYLEYLTEDSRFAAILQVISEHEARLAELEGKSDPEAPKTVPGKMMLSGKIKPILKEQNRTEE